MNQPKLTLHDLAHGLERFGDRYQAIDVFADDIHELGELQAGRTVDYEAPAAG